jgi:hypothetical protein
MSKHTFKTCISFGTDGEADYIELDVTVRFNVAWGMPESGRFSGPPEDYDPGGPDEIEDFFVVKVDGWPAVDTDLAKMIEEKMLDTLYDEMIASATEDEVAAEEAAAEHRHEERKIIDIDF